MTTLHTPARAGSIELANRIVMAPMTRGRSGPDGTPGPHVAEYYRQRASAGLIITEATSAIPGTIGWPGSPGLFTDAHEAAWSEVTRAVHDAGGRIVVQLWHMGRAIHPDFVGGRQPVSASDVAATGEIPTPSGEAKPFAQPRPLTIDEIAELVEGFGLAAERARRAGFDGVEVHAANSFLIDQFIRDGSNQRADEYGGSIDNRLRFLREVVDRTGDAIGFDRVGVRVSPTHANGGLVDSTPEATFTRAAEQLSERQIAYLHVLEPTPGGGHPMASDTPAVAPSLRAAFDGTLIVNAGYDQTTGAEAIASGAADAVAYGVPFIANPDLVERFRNGDPLAAPDPNTFYTSGPEGYVDYPRLRDATTV